MRILRFLRLTLVLTVCVLGTAAAVLHIPAVQRGLLHQVFDRFDSDLGFRIDVDTFRFNLFMGTLTAGNTSLVPVPAETPAGITAAGIVLDLSITDLINGYINVDRIAVTEPVFTLVQRDDGSLAWPWKTGTTGVEDTDSRTPGSTGRRPFQLTVHDAVLKDGTVSIQSASPGDPLLSVTGIEIDGTMDFRAMMLDAGLTVEQAVWRNTSSDSLRLTQPLTVSARRNGGPIQVHLDTEVDKYQINATGRFTPEISPPTFDLKINGNGDPTGVLTGLGMDDLVVPMLQIEAILNRDGPGSPGGTFTVEARNVTAGTQTFNSVTVTGNLSPDSVSADVAATSPDGELLATVKAPLDPMDGPWDQTLQLRNVSLSILKPWLPDILDLDGIANGHLTATGMPSDWTVMNVTGHLDLTQPKQPETSATPMESSGPILPPYPLHPSGSFAFSMADRIVSVQNLRLDDPNHSIRLTGQWNIDSGVWSAQTRIASRTLAPWFALGGTT
ncbi:MAG TPA: hypothetical protein PLV45_04500, partial [bacterium]|nr:hypothetical protein [bacterium]